VTRAVIALGANLGEREVSIADAIADLAAIDGVSIVAQSTLMSTVAVTESGPDDTHPEYLNGVVIVDTTISAHTLLAMLHDIELRHGRVRAERWGDRTLDLDLIVYGDLIENGNLVIPHPRAHERRFVLEPWLSVDPDAIIPARGFVRDLVEVLA
jgi:2-amino-4-hydroxy-6-hydroxymethyldihydropteridine diphosphokinase